MQARAALEHYLTYLAQDGRRPHTLRGYRGDLSPLVTAAEATGGVLGQAAVSAFLRSLANLAPATQARRRSSLRGFLRWARDNGLVGQEIRDDVPRPTRPGHTPAAAQAPTPDDVRTVLAGIPRQADLDQLVFGLLARVGLRPGEALALQMEDFDESTESLSVPGRGGRRRMVLVDDRQILLRLVNWKRAIGRRTGPMFTAPGRATPLRYQSLLARWECHTTAAGLSIRLTDLRRAHAAELLAAGVPEWAVRQRLGQHNGPLTGPEPAGADAGAAIRGWRSRQSRAVRTTPPTTRRGRSTG